MSIFSAAPFNLTNGTTADATQVMANINQIISNGNAGCATNGANSNITSLTGLSTPLSTAQGGTGVTTGVSLTPYTPTDQSGASLSITNNGSFYYQLGKIVYLSFNVSYPSTVNGTAAALSVPVTAASATVSANSMLGLFRTGGSPGRPSGIGAGGNMDFFSSTNSNTLLVNSDISTLQLVGNLQYIAA